MNTVKELPADVDSKVKSMQPPAGKSLVYGVRPTTRGKPFGGIITANDEYIGATQGALDTDAEIQVKLVCVCRFDS